jgi:hypothetical protein
MRRLGSAFVCLLALGLLAAGANMVGQPLGIGGPMHFDFHVPIGVAYLAGGVVLLDGLQTAPGWVYLLAALAILISAGRNFYNYPPIADGAYFLLRYGRDALDNWAPPEPFASMLAFALAGWAATRSFGAVGPRLIRLAAVAAGVAASCAAYELFMRRLIAGAKPVSLGSMLCGLAVFAAGCGGWAARYDAARAGLGFAVTTVLVSLASWALYQL